MNVSASQKRLQQVVFPLSQVQAAMIPHTVSHWHRAAKRQALMPFCW